MISSPKVDIIKQSKKLPLVVTWGTKNIDLGEIVFLGDNSLVFESRFFGSQNAGGSISFGLSVHKGGKFNNQPADRFAVIDSGFHVTLHTPKNNKPGVMNFSNNSQGSPLHRREIDWFPVKTPFNLVRGFTLPIDICSHTKKKSVLLTSIDPAYHDSLEYIIDVFPLDTKEHRPYENCIEIWGNCPEYRVRVSLLLAKQRQEAFIYWPDDSQLVL